MCVCKIQPFFREKLQNPEGPLNFFLEKVQGSSMLKYSLNRGSVRRLFRLDRAFGSRVTLEHAKQLPTQWSEMSNNDLLRWCGPDGILGANEERVARHVMAADDLSWEEVQPIIWEMRKFLGTERKAFLYNMPYRIGLGTAVGGGIVSVPLIFHKGSVLAFNEACVSMEVPPPSDLDTILEIGSWSWNWMEPVLGTASFLILCAQFARNQMLNLHLRPYTNWYKIHTYFL